MAEINYYLQLYAAIPMIIILIANLLSGWRRDRPDRLFYGMLCSDIVMLLAGAADYYMLFQGSRDNLPVLLFEGISDCTYFVILALFILYLDLYGKEKDVKPGWIAVTGASVSIVYGVFWFIADAYDLIYSQSAEAVTGGTLYLVGQIGGYVTAVLSVVILIKRWRYFGHAERFAFSFFIAGPLIASLLKGIITDVMLMPIMVTISIITIQCFVQASRELTMQQKETELARMKTDLFMSRMKPHFVYNVLNAIYGLCDISSDRTKEAVAMFAQYLRDNLIDLDRRERIPLKDELAIVKNYLAIEKLRFGDLLEVEYHIIDDSFLIPPLTVQTIVENAVRHGIEKKPGGGRVIISDEEQSDAWIIRVSDTGTGFDPGEKELYSSKPDERGKSHIGLYSTRYRLRELCDGDISLESSPGAGTMVTMRIPKEDRTRVRPYLNDLADYE